VSGRRPVVVALDAVDPAIVRADAVVDAALLARAPRAAGAGPRHRRRHHPRQIEVAHLGNLTLDEAVEVGTVVGLGIEGEEGLEKGAEAGALAAADGFQVFSDDQDWDVLVVIPTTRRPGWFRRRRAAAQV
jgi:hypothetical protein